MLQSVNPLLSFLDNTVHVHLGSEHTHIYIFKLFVKKKQDNVKTSSKRMTLKAKIHLLLHMNKLYIVAYT